MITTNAAPAQTLRTALRTAGFNSRRVTVHHDQSTLRLTIRDAAASLSKVQAIADQFVSVRYTDALVAPVKAAIVVLLGPAADDEIVSLLGDFRAAKVSRQRGATYAEEVRI